METAKLIRQIAAYVLFVIAATWFFYEMVVLSTAMYIDSGADLNAYLLGNVYKPLMYAQVHQELKACITPTAIRSTDALAICAVTSVGMVTNSGRLSFPITAFPSMAALSGESLTPLSARSAKNCFGAETT